MDAYDRERAHHNARESASNMYDQHYVRDQGADQYDPNQYPPRQDLYYNNDNNQGGY